MKYLWLLLIPAISFADVCDANHVIASILPGVSFSINGSDLTTFQVLDGSETPAPTKNQLMAATATCQQGETQTAAYQLELSTTVAAVSALGTGYIASNAITQIQYNAKIVRIIQLRAILGIP